MNFYLVIFIPMNIHLIFTIYSLYYYMYSHVEFYLETFSIFVIFSILNLALNEVPKDQHKYLKCSRKFEINWILAVQNCLKKVQDASAQVKFTQENFVLCSLDLLGWM